MHHPKTRMQILFLFDDKCNEIKSNSSDLYFLTFNEIIQCIYKGIWSKNIKQNVHSKCWQVLNECKQKPPKNVKEKKAITLGNPQKMSSEKQILRLGCNK
jgi:hypothetical protein